MTTLMLSYWQKPSHANVKYANVERQTLSLSPHRHYIYVVLYGENQVLSDGTIRNTIFKKTFISKFRAIKFLLENGFVMIDDLSDSKHTRYHLGRD